MWIFNKEDLYKSNHHWLKLTSQQTISGYSQSFLETLPTSWIYYHGDHCQGCHDADTGYSSSSSSSSPHWHQHIYMYCSKSCPRTTALSDWSTSFSHSHILWWHRRSRLKQSQGSRFPQSRFSQTIQPSAIAVGNLKCDDNWNSIKDCKCCIRSDKILVYDSTRDEYFPKKTPMTSASFLTHWVHIKLYALHIKSSMTKKEWMAKWRKEMLALVYKMSSFQNVINQPLLRYLLMEHASFQSSQLINVELQWWPATSLKTVNSACINDYYS